MDKLLLQALQSGDKDKILQALKANIPSKLYKFVWLEGSDSDKKKFQSLEDGNLWISKINEFNDPFEFKGIVLNKEKFQEYGFPEEVIKEYEASIDLSDTYGVCCLSHTPLEYLPMWAYYTNTQRGFCIEYDVIDTTYINRVIYEENRTSVFSTLLQLIDELKILFSDDPAKETKKFDIKKANTLGYLFLMNLFIKSDNWKHEQEYRIAYPLDFSDRKKGENISIEKLGLKMSRIIAGYKCRGNDLEELERISRKLNGDGIYQLVLSDTDFAVIEKKYK